MSNAYFPGTICTWSKWLIWPIHIYLFCFELLKFDWCISTACHLGHKYDVFACSLYGFARISLARATPCIGSSTDYVSHLWVRALLIHAACSSPNRKGDVPLLDRREMRIFVVSDSNSVEEIGIRHRLFLVQHVDSCVELICMLWSFWAWFGLFRDYFFFFVEVEKICYLLI